MSSTEVVTRPAVPADVARALEERKVANLVAAEIAKLSWGQSIGRDTARAVAEWGRRYNVDVTQEIDVLGGRIYLNARFYIRRLADLVAAGVVEYAEPDHVENDPRLASWPEEAERRLRERIKHGLPDAAKGAVVFRVKLRGMEREITGTEACGGGIAKGDPVGDSEPIKTAETRAARRAMRLIVSHVPALQDELQVVEASVVDVESAIEADHNRDDLLPARRTTTPLLSPPDPYAAPKSTESEYATDADGNVV
jgi:hypothetical protein